MRLIRLTANVNDLSGDNPNWNVPIDTICEVYSDEGDYLIVRVHNDDNKYFPVYEGEYQYIGEKPHENK